MSENTNPDAIDPQAVYDKLERDHEGREVPDYATVRRILIDAYRVGLSDRPVAY